MKWLDDYEKDVLEYIATVPFEERKTLSPGKYVDDIPRSNALDRLYHRKLVYVAHRCEEGSTFKITLIGSLIRSAIKIGSVSI